MKLIYITNSRIPTTKAQGFQIMKMCEALAREGINVELWIPRRMNPIKDSPFNYYSIRESFSIIKIPVLDLIPLYRIIGQLANFIESMSFAVFTIYHLYRSGLTQIVAEKRGKLIYENETYKIRGACFKIWKQFRGGFNEKLIERALINELIAAGLKVENQKRQDIIYNNQKIGTQIFDIVVNEEILIELKCAPFLRRESKNQFWTYLKNSPYKLGLLINFGNKLEIERRIFDNARLPHESAINPHRSASNETIIYSRDQFTLWLLSFLNHKFVYEMHKMPLHPGLYRRIWRKARKIITITAVLKNAIAKEGAQPSKILVAHDGVDLEIFNSINKSAEELKTELNLSERQFLVGYVGKFKTLEQEKGLKTMIEALSLLDKEVKMAFVGGDMAEVKEYKSLAQRFNVLPQCVFIGYQPYRRMAQYMKAMDAVVLPSPDKPLAHYSSPLKLFEYMASGRPIIASDLPAIREILNDKNALFFKPDSRDDLARAIKMLKASPTLGYHISRQALTDAQNYTWTSRAKNILEFFQDSF